jgi:hypothetical protein
LPDPDPEEFTHALEINLGSAGRSI